MRDIRFDGHYGTMLFVSAGGRVDYQVAGNAAIFLGGTLDTYFHKEGRYRYLRHTDGRPVGGRVYDAGTGLFAMKLNAG